MTARRRRITPGVVFLTVALIGSLVFVLYAVTVRDASQIPLLAAGGAALGLGLGGGIAAMIGAGCMAGAVILFLLSRPPG